MNPALVEIPDYVPAEWRDRLAVLTTPRGHKVLWWVLGVLLGLAIVAFLAVGANGPPNPSLSQGGRRLHLTAADGRQRHVCVLVADTPAARARGLMQRTDLGGHAGMAFVFDGDTDTGFYMRNTPMPLTVAWFAADGTFVSSAAMAPCADVDGCHVYEAARPYRLAVEVPQGRTAELAIGPGSRARLGGACA